MRPEESDGVLQKRRMLAPFSSACAGGLWGGPVGKVQSFNKQASAWSWILCAASSFRLQLDMLSSLSPEASSSSSSSCRPSSLGGKRGGRHRGGPQNVLFLDLHESSVAHLPISPENALLSGRSKRPLWHVQTWSERDLKWSTCAKRGFDMQSNMQKSKTWCNQILWSCRWLRSENRGRILSSRTRSARPSGADASETVLSTERRRSEREVDLEIKKRNSTSLPAKQAKGRNDARRRLTNAFVAKAKNKLLTGF